MATSDSATPRALGVRPASRRRRGDLTDDDVERMRALLHLPCRCRTNGDPCVTPDGCPRELAGAAR